MRKVDQQGRESEYGGAEGRDERWEIPGEGRGQYLKRDRERSHKSWG